jgi:fibro-slime domain-containing protein
MRSAVILVFGFCCVACGSHKKTFDNPDTGDPFMMGGDGGTLNESGGGGGTGMLTATIRDFKLYNSGDPSTNPDFEHVPTQQPDAQGNWNDPGVVQPQLGADRTPVYKSSSTTLTTHGKAAFDQWYHDTPGTNYKVSFPVMLSPQKDGSWSYDSMVFGTPVSPNDPTKNFFPIDDGTPYQTPFGNQGDLHNYSFTVELHTVFTYKGGEYFTFRGDDDVWVFIDGKLVIDLGGIHAPEMAMVSLDTLGLTANKEYTLDFFSAERHKTWSNILFTTTLDLRPPPN